MSDFGKIVRKVLISEGFADDGTLYVYHFTHKENLDSIAKGGFDRYFTGKNSNAYGPGVYTNMEPSCSADSPAYNDLDRQRIHVYGSMMLKLRVVKGGLRSFIIFEEAMAKKIYRNHWRVEDQLKLILSKDEYERIKAEFPREWDYMCHAKVPYTSYLGHKAADMCKQDKAFDNAVKGYVFNGPVDGYVCIFKDFTSLKPVAVSFDLGKTFKPISVHPRFEEYVQNNFDIWRELGYDAEKHYDVKTDRKRYGSDAFYDVLPKYFTKNFARVEKNGKYNYLYIKTFKNGPISPVWFDAAPVTFNDAGIANVSVDGTLYKIRNYNDEFLVYDENGKLISLLDDFNPQKLNQKRENVDDLDFEYD